MNPVNRVVASVQIGNIRLSKINAEAHIRNAQEAGDVGININYKTGLPAPPASDGTFFVIAEFNVDIVSVKTSDVMFSLNARFELTYRIPTDLDYGEDEMKQFAATNAVFNAWPYLREVVQSTLARMNLPAFPVPLYRQDKLPPAGSAPSTSEAKAHEKLGKGER